MSFVSKIASTRFVQICACSVALCLASVAQADLISLTATQNPSLESSFTFDFGAFGGPRSALISQTDFVLNVDPGAAPGSSAVFASYFQTVDSIGLPNPQGGADLPTGVLNISIEESYGGTFDELTGVVTTSDLYKIEFSGDLSALGIFSPVFLPGESLGQVDFDTPTTGAITLNWDGVGNISGIDFSYACATHTTFTPEPASLALLGLAGLMIRRRR